MSRMPRLISPTGMYHVILRSVNQQQIFEDQSDYQKFLFILDDVRKKYNLKIYAYCLMSNHIHLLVYASSNVLSTSFQSLSVRFVLWYNKKYQRFGHLFQARFTSKPIESNSQFLRTLCYIHQNPIKAFICKYVDEYPWSSVFAYYGKRDPITSIDKAIDIMGSLEMVQNYFKVNQLSEDDSFEASPTSKGVIDEYALSLFHDITECRSPADFQILPRSKRTELIRSLSKHKLTQNQISRFCGISRTTVYRVLTNYQSKIVK